MSASSHSPSDYLTHLTNLQLSTSNKKSSRSKPRANLVNVSGVVQVSEEERAREEGWKSALKGLEVVRLALARFLARELLG